MAEACALLLFAAAIVVCATTGVSVVFALCFGFFVFTGYGLFKGFTLRALFPMMMKGVKATAGIVIVMGLIGMLTGSWRASGTIARLVGDAAGFISPAWSLTTVFLINGAVSTLLGTSFGTAATLGVISMTMTNAMGVDPFLAGGAVLAGVFVGDRPLFPGFHECGLGGDRHPYVALRQHPTDARHGGASHGFGRPSLDGARIPASGPRR